MEPGSGWLVREVELNIPTKGKHYVFTCKQWLAKDKSDGKTSRLLAVNDGQSSLISYKPSKFVLDKSTGLAYTWITCLCLSTPTLYWC